MFPPCIYNSNGGFYALRVRSVFCRKRKCGFQPLYRNAVPQRRSMSAYLMVFHKDEDHGLHMAISPTATPL